MDSKYPYANLRKQLRLLIEDPDPMEELENDITYVYSGYAPISVRLVQCIAQKGGVLSNPAGDKDKKGGDGDSSRRSAAAPLVQAHPIVGWKGFEDVAAAIPGATVDIVQRLPTGQDGSLPPVASLSGYFASHIMIMVGRYHRADSCAHSASERPADNDGGVLPGRMHVYGDRCAALGGPTEQRWARAFLCERQN